jgi:ComF family protein
MPLRGALDALVSVLFPAPCRVCHQPLSTASRIPVCPACLAAVRRIAPPLCLMCGRPFSPAAATVAEPICHDCVRNLYHFDLARSFARYDSAMEHILLLLKYDPVAPLATWLAARLEEVVRSEPALAEVDWIVPIPLDRGRLRQRGYNQAELIARPLARSLGRPLATDLLRRLRSRPPKLKLSRRERWDTVRGAFEASSPARVDRSRILLVDDVLTSGATLDACAHALLSAGAAAVHAVTVARVPPRGEFAASWDNPQGGASVTP